MLFDTGASHPVIHPEIASRVKVDRFYKVTDNPLPRYHVPFTIVGLPPLDIDLIVDLEERKTLLPPRIFTKIYSINFAQTGQIFATFKPKQIGGIMYKTLYAKDTRPVLTS